MIPTNYMEYDNDQQLYLAQIYYNPMIFDVYKPAGGPHLFRRNPRAAAPGRMNATLQELHAHRGCTGGTQREEACQALEYHFTKRAVFHDCLCGNPSYEERMRNR
jgi:hypothetical protein